MNKQLTPNELGKLSVSDQLRLIEDVWTSLEAESDTVEVPDWHRAELDARLAEHAQNPGSARPWAEVKQEILAALRK